MCTVSMIGDHYRDKWAPAAPAYPATPNIPLIINPVTREEFDALRRDVLEMKALLRRAKAYDEANGEPDCEMDEKLAVLKKVAELVGVDLSDVLGYDGSQADGD